MRESSFGETALLSLLFGEGILQRKGTKLTNPYYTLNLSYGMA